MRINKLRVFFIFSIIFCGYLEVGSAKDCGIAPSGFSFGPNCEMNRSSGAKKSTSPDAAQTPEDKSRWEEVRLTLQSGKPGYMIAVGVGFKQNMEAILMNETVTDDVDRAFIRAAPGSFKTCQANGLHQSIGFTLFKVRGCK